MFDSAWASTSGNAFLLVDRAASPTMTVRQPALPVRVANGKRLRRKRAMELDRRRQRPRQARRAGHLGLRRVDGLIRGISLDAASGLQSYPNGKSFSGTAASNYADGWLGFVTKKEPGTGTDAALGLAPGSPRTWNTRYFDPGLPWGTWQVCADDGSRRSFVTVNNKNRAGTANSIVLDLKSSTSASGTCTGISSWPTPTTPQEVS